MKTTTQQLQDMRDLLGGALAVAILFWIAMQYVCPASSTHGVAATQADSDGDDPKP